MFIYLKKSREAVGYRYLIKKAECGNGFYFEISFPSTPTARRIQKAVKRCGKGDKPIVSSVIEIPKKLKHRTLPTKQYDRVLALNAFAAASKGNREALIVDGTGDMSAYISPVLSVVGTLYVVTDNIKAYEEVALQNLRSVGSSAVILNAVPPTFFKTAFCVSRETAANCAVRFGEGGLTAFGNEVRLGKKVFDRSLMTAVFYTGGDSRVSRCVPQFLTDGQQNFSLDTLCRTTV